MKIKTSFCFWVNLLCLFDFRLLTYQLTIKLVFFTLHSPPQPKLTKKNIFKCFLFFSLFFIYVHSATFRRLNVLMSVDTSSLNLLKIFNNDNRQISAIFAVARVAATFFRWDIWNLNKKEKNMRKKFKIQIWFLFYSIFIASHTRSLSPAQFFPILVIASRYLFLRW